MREGLLEDDRLEGIDWHWLSMNGALTKAPLGRGKNRPQPYPTDRDKGGVKRSRLTEGHGVVLSVVIEGANWHDGGGASGAPAGANACFPAGDCAWTRGYDDDEIRSLVAAFSYTAPISVPGAWVHKAGFKAWRWLIERAHSRRNR